MLPARLSVTLRLQVPSPLSPQYCTLDRVKLMLSWVAPIALLPVTPGRFTKTLCVPEGEVSVTVRSPIWVWVTLSASVIWSIRMPVPAKLTVSTTVALSAMKAPGAEAADSSARFVLVLTLCQVSARRTAAWASTRP